MTLSLRNVPLSTLQYILGGITIVGGTSLYLKSNYEANQFYNTRIMKQAIDVASHNSELKALLGEPIKGGKVNFKDERNFMTESAAHFEVPLTGKIHNAIMLVDAMKVKEDSEWELDQVNIQFKRKEKIIAQINIFKRT